MVETISFDYGQRHAVELQCRADILKRIQSVNPDWEDRLGVDHSLDLGVLGEISETALTRSIQIELEDGGLPNTFVPGRNLAFLVLSAALAYRRGVSNLIIGVCQTDYSGYPDCRDDAIKAMQVALNLGMESRFCLHTPLMHLTKSDTWRLADSLGGASFIDLIVRRTHTCYQGNRTKQHDWGYGCGICPACELRATGYLEFAESS